MQQVDVNVLSVLVAGLASMPLGFLWYGPLFGKTWAKEYGFTKEDEKKAKAKGMATTYLVATVGALVMSYVFAHVLEFAETMTLSEALQGAFFVWLGFIATTMLNNVLFGGKSLKLFAIESGYQLANLMVMAIILMILA